MKDLIAGKRQANVLIPLFQRHHIRDVTKIQIHPTPDIVINPGLVVGINGLTSPGGKNQSTFGFDVAAVNRSRAEHRSVGNGDRADQPPLPAKEDRIALQKYTAGNITQ